MKGQSTDAGEQKAAEKTTHNKQCSWLSEEAWILADQEPMASDGSHWATCGELLAQHDTEIVGAWKTGIQNQLIVVRLHLYCAGSTPDRF